MAFQSFPEHETHCSCPLPAGCWGTGGAHLTHHDQGSLLRRIAALEARGNQTGADIERQLLPQHMGLVYVYERCPAYLEGVRRKAGAKKATKRAAASHASEYE